MSDAIYLREDGTGIEIGRGAMSPLAGRTEGAGGNVEGRGKVARWSTVDPCQEIKATHHQKGGRRSKAAQRAAQAQESPTHNRPTGPDDGRRAAGSTVMRNAAQTRHRATQAQQQATHHTRLTPHLRQRTYLLPCEAPSQKLFQEI